MNLFFSQKNFIGILVLIIALFVFSPVSLLAQSEDNSGIKPLRSDVGINGLTANFHGLSDFEYLGSDTLDADSYDGSSELEFVFRDVRMMTPQLGVGFQLLTSFFIDNSGDETNFGVGSWGIGPVVRYYPFKSDRFQPYAQANSMLGNNLAVGRLANTKNKGDGFRVRLGLRGGVAYRLTNNIGLFIEGGPDWGSGRLFRANARTYQLNIGIDLYRFN